MYAYAIALLLAMSLLALTQPRNMIAVLQLRYCSYHDHDGPPCCDCSPNERFAVCPLCCCMPSLLLYALSAKQRRLTLFF